MTPLDRSKFLQAAPAFEAGRLRLAAVVMVGILAAPPRDLAAAEVHRPNIIFIIADDLGIGEPGCYGGKLPTPHIDSLAAQGVRFTSGYVTAPFCAASRAALLTGRYQTRFGFEFNPVGAANSDPEIGLPVNERTLGDVLQNAGYATALVGKWHLGGTAAFHPQRRGFDEFFGFLHEGHYYVPPPFENHVTWLRRRTLPDGSEGQWTSPDGRTIWSTHMKSFEPDYDSDNPILRSSQPVEVQDSLTDAFTREAEGFIRRHASQPFFLCLAYNAVHSPLQGRDAELQKLSQIENVQRRIFAAMLTQLDDGVGRVLKTLSDLKLEDNTLVVFLSDNGGPTRELTSSNWPYQGEKGQLLEGGIRVPLLLRWPARIPAGRIEERMMSSMDLFATAAAGAGVPPLPQVDGVDLLPFLTSNTEAPIHDNMFWRMGDQAAYRSGDWKLLCRSRVKERPNWELFNLHSDPGETKNVAVEFPEKTALLESGWRSLNGQMIPARWQQGGGRGKRLEDPAATRERF